MKNTERGAGKPGSRSTIASATASSGISARAHQRRTPRRRIARFAGLLVVGVLSTIGGCGAPFSLTDLIDGPDGHPLTVSPSSGTIIANSTVALLASGGHPPYTYELVSGNGSLSDNLFTAPPATGAEVVRVADRVGAAVEVTFTIDAGGLNLGISPTTQTVYTGGTVTFQAIGGSGPFSFEITENTSGAGMTDNVYVAGSYTGAGTVTDTVTVTDLSDLSTASAAVTVQAKPLGVWPTTISVVPGQQFEFVPIGGDGPFSFEITENHSGAPEMNGRVYTAGPVTDEAPDIVTMTDAYDGRTVQAAVTVVSVSTNVDYAAGAITTIFGGMRTNTDFTAEATIQNVGSANGTKDVHWTVFASTDEQVGGSDFVVASGTVAGGIEAGGLVVVPINGRWPGVPGEYYLLVTVSAADDLVQENNTGSSGGTIRIVEPVSVSPSSFTVYTGQQIPFTAAGGGPFAWSIDPTGDSSGATIDPDAGLYTAGPNPGEDTVRVTDWYDGATAVATITVLSQPLPTAVDYTVVSVERLSGGLETGDPVGGTVSIANIGSGDGAYAIAWAVYASATPEVGGTVVATGTGSPVNAGGTGLIDWAGSWPLSPGAYYLVATLSAVDDTILDNNAGASAIAYAITQPIVEPANVDYFVEGGSAGGAREVGAPLSEGFSVRNGGAEDGTADLYWSVFLSPTPNYSAGDELVATGTVPGGLPAGGWSGQIAVSGAWPPTAGEYYLIVRLQAADDINLTNNTAASGVFYVTEPGIVDYRITQITRYETTPLAGSPVQESFTVSNVGSADGTAPFDWYLYVSVSSELESGALLLASRIGVEPLPAGASYNVGYVPNTWPSESDEYFLIAQVVAEGGSVTDVRSQGPFWVREPADYTVGFASIQFDDGAPGQPLGLTGPFGFLIRNVGADGWSSVVWRVYASLDPSLDATDVLLTSGVHPPLPANGESGLLDFSDAVWPELAARYFLIITVSADDDPNPQNDVQVLGPIDVPRVYVEGAENNNSFGPTNVPLLNVSNLDPVLAGYIRPFELVKIFGTGDTGGPPQTFRVDTYRLTIGPGVMRLRAYAEWATGADHIDIWAWDEYNHEWYSLDLAANREPGSGVFDVGGWMEGEAAYVAVQFLEGFGTAPYTLYIFGAP